ncbi:hypothetical protein M3Y96_00475000 [Aphelenchoides besseyi]|nr:hypothetical protein M3Y96_00475000 [Aphelenchoides besseyi]
MSDEKRLFEYFIVAGLQDGQHEELTPLSHECGNKVTEQVAPITDICVIFPSLGETVPKGYSCIDTTPSGHPADLNHGSFRTNSVFLCYKRGYHKPPLVDIGILDESKEEKVKVDSIIIDRTPLGHSANVNNSSSGLYFTARRSTPNAPPHQLVITHICVILTTKGETPPHTYFRIDRNLNKAMVGSDVYVCYKKAQSCSKRISYKPNVLDCYPKVDDIEDSIAKNVPMFCLPMGAVIESWSDRCGQPDKTFSTCVLTDEMGTKYYGASLTFYERYGQQLDESQREKLEPATPDEADEDAEEEYMNATVSYYSNKAICIVSRYPFYEPFRKFLYFLHGLSTTGPHRLPIERYISHLMFEVPFPTPSRPRVFVQLNEEMNTFESHDDSQVPLSGAAFVDSLKHLGVENMMYMMLLAILEQKILIHSLRPWLLTTVAETLCALMFPFHWQCPYIPQCPLGLAGVLQAPVPFICGVHSRYFDLYEDPPADVTCFDLDTCTISQSTIRKNLKLNILPKKPLKKLRTALEKIFVEIQKPSREIATNTETKKLKDLRIREEFLRFVIFEWKSLFLTFLRFVCTLMSGYSDFLTPIVRPTDRKNATDVKTLFDLSSFIKSRDKNSQDFYRRFVETQSFNRFIEERSYLTERSVYNVFFDDSVKKVEEATIEGNVATVQLLDQDAFIANRTIVVPMPEMLGENKTTTEFTYNGFPAFFDHQLFETDLILRTRLHSPQPQPLKREDSDECTLHLPYVWIRSKQEIRISLSDVRQCLDKSEMFWPRSLLFYAYSLWFMQLPSILHLSRNKIKILRLAFRVLARMETSNLAFHDQVCYRVLIHLCGENGRPELAAQVLEKMRRWGVPLNAITYGVYHRAVTRGEWPTTARIRAIRKWTLLRTVLEAMATLRAARSRTPSTVPPPPVSTPNRTPTHHAAQATSTPTATPTTTPSSGTPNFNSFPRTNSSTPHSISSPSLSSLMSQFRKQTIKGNKFSIDVIGLFVGVDGIMQQSTAIFKKSGLNTIMNEAKNLKNHSLTRNHSTSFSTLSSSDENLDCTVGYDPTNDGVFQLDSGSCGDLLKMEFWMRDLMPETFAEFVGMNPMNTERTPLDVTMCSSCVCPGCSTVVYDEELMAGWSTADDANLNSICPLCSVSFAPTLKISLQPRELDQLTSSWYRPMSSQFSTQQKTHETDPLSAKNAKGDWDHPLSESYVEPEKSNGLPDAPDGDKINPNDISVPFLSPLVLRKELEVLMAANPLILAQSSLRQSHPIIFWNLLFYSRRLDVPSHLFGWIAPHVHIRCVYDLPHLHSPDFQPIYVSTRDPQPAVDEKAGDSSTAANYRLRQLIVSSLPEERGLLRIIQCIVQHHREVKNNLIGLRPHFSIYRDILFVALSHFGRSVDREQYDREFQSQLERFPQRIQGILKPADMAPRSSVIACRRVFMPLDLN